MEEKKVRNDWNVNYEYAKIYYKHYKNLNMLVEFRTNDGYTYNENGKIQLGWWVYQQRRKVKPDSKKGKLLLEIGMKFIPLKEIKWEEKYKYAKKYYEHYGNLLVPSNFKTNDGYTHNENGKVLLGRWISDQKRTLNPESERAKKLLEIGMIFCDIYDLRWKETYEYAKIYYEHYGNLDVPRQYKTNNGYERTDAGKILLGEWIFKQRKRVDPESEKGRLLKEIGMVFGPKKVVLEWDEMYEYAKSYYEHHNNLDISANFKTNDGYTYDEKGKIALGVWVERQKRTIQPESERGKKLLEIGLNFKKIKDQQWEEMYEYAKIYYKHHKNLNIPFKFRTNNGYERCEDGKINLGRWVSFQRKRINPESEKGKKLIKIGMDFTVKEQFITEKNQKQWDRMYVLALNYYNYHKNLDVPNDFKTLNGYEYNEEGSNLGRWLITQRNAYEGMIIERKKKLQAIGFKTFEANGKSWTDSYKLAEEYYKHYKNSKIPASFKTLNGYEYDSNGKCLGQWISNQRSMYNNLSNEQKKLLKKIGFVPDYYENKWYERYKLLKKYHEHHGNANIPQNFKTINGYDYSEKGTFFLDKWLENQISNRSELSEEKIKLLEKLDIFEILNIEEKLAKIDNSLKEYVYESIIKPILKVTENEVYYVEEFALNKLDLTPNELLLTKDILKSKNIKILTIQQEKEMLLSMKQLVEESKDSISLQLKKSN